jgi:hypothetical protein
MFFRNRVLLAKMQPDPAVDPTPDASNAIKSQNLNWSPYEGNRIDLEEDRLALGNFQSINTSPQIGMSCEVYLTGAGDAADTVPGFGPLLRACGLSETVNASTDVTYAPVSSGFEEVALYFVREVGGAGVLHKALNCKGNVQIQLSAESLPLLQFDGFVGKFVEPISPSDITPAPANFGSVIAVTESNTPTFEIDADGTPWTPCINSFSFNLGNTVAWKDEPNCVGSIIEDRRSTGQIVFKAPNLGDKDIWDWIMAHAGVTLTDLAVEHGSTAGDIFGVTIPAVQFTSISETNVRGELYYTVDYAALPTSAGDDEISIITK